MGQETYSFQTEVGKLLDIVAHSLYSHKEIFLRELISNASDACDRLRFAALTDPDLIDGDSDFRILLEPDAKAKTLAVIDDGIGMNRDELVENLGTIARSGTQAFMDQLSAAKDAKEKGDKTGDDMALIGQFGVGFYSAFMVADKVEVTLAARRARTPPGNGYPTARARSPSRNRHAKSNGTTVLLRMSARTPSRVPGCPRADPHHRQDLFRPCRLPGHAARRARARTRTLNAGSAAVDARRPRTSPRSSTPNSIITWAMPSTSRGGRFTTGRGRAVLHQPAVHPLGSRRSTCSIPTASRG